MLRGLGLVGVLVVVLVVLKFFGGDEAAPLAPGPVVAVWEPPLVKASTGREFFVTPEGKPTNPGTKEAPVDLATALSSNTPASPGDVIWLRAGTYVGNFVSSLTGTEAAPIQVRQAAGERATLVAAKLQEPVLTADGAWTWFRDFEIASSPRARAPGASAGAGAGDDAASLRQGGGIAARGANLAFVNLAIHDLVKGIDVQAGATGTLLSGNLIYDSGWQDPLRGSGVKMAAGNADAYVLDNIVFRSGTTGISVSMHSGDRLQLEGNISFNNGFATEFFDRNLLVEGGKMRVNDNYTYYTPGKRGGENNFGYTAGCQNIEASGNYWAHPESYPFTFSKCDGKLTGNTLIGASDAASRYPDNTYIRNKATGLKTFVRSDRYDDERVHIVIFNWDRHPNVNVDVTNAKMAPGTLYEIRDVQDYFGEPVASGIYQGGRLGVPMTGLKVVRPAGAAQTTDTVHTAPDFGVFVLIKSPKAQAPKGGRP